MHLYVHIRKQNIRYKYFAHREICTHDGIYIGNHLVSYKKVIGKKIQRRRMEQGFGNQTVLAEKLGVDQAQLSKWESGKNMPEGKLRAALAEALSVDDLFFETIDITDLILDDKRSDAVRLILSLPEVHLATITGLIKGLVGKTAVDKDEAGG